MSKKAVYVYPAYIEELPSCFKIEFIGFRKIVKGKEIEKTIVEAKEKLAEFILEYGDNVPKPKKINEIKNVEGKAIIMIETNINVYKYAKYNKTITRAVTLPYNMNEQVKASGLNASKVLQDALKEIFDEDFDNEE